MNRAVIPAQAGIQYPACERRTSGCIASPRGFRLEEGRAALKLAQYAYWIPAFAGMTDLFMRAWLLN